jgi:trk system potassium uptake protein TrkH
MIGRRLAARMRSSPERIADAVRMLGVGVISALGQRIVDMPIGYLGAASQATLFGVIYAVAVLLGTVSCGVAVIAGRRWARGLFAVLTVAALVVFLPALTSDVALAGSIIAWQIGALARLFGATPTSARLASRRHVDPMRPTVVHLLMLAIFATMLVIGFEAADTLTIELVCLVLDVIALVAIALSIRREPRTDRPMRVLLGASLSLVVLALLSLTPLFSPLAWFGLFQLEGALALLGVVQTLVLLLALRNGPLFAELIELFLQRPAVLVAVTFGVIAAIGSVALSFPAAAQSGPISPIDALFTSVSATCVNGLTVVDTPTAFSNFGEGVIVVLVEIGGLGMMVLSTFATVILGGRLTLRGEQALGQVLELSTPGHAYRLTRFIVVASLAIEAVGAAILTWRFQAHGYALQDAIWCGVFHSVASFCNAGFALQSDSIIMFQSDPIALATVAVLVIIGGLGFLVLSWLWGWAIRRERNRPPVQVRVVLWMSAALTILGAVAYGLLEWRATLEGLSVVDKLTNAAFQSVTMRSAGYNTVPLSAIQPATILLMMVWMFIGAAPGGTGGGIKVTTLAVLAAAIPDIVGSRAGTTLFGRSIAPAVLQRAATITVVALMATSLVLFVLLLSEDAPFELLAFEAVSALGTVGLSLGVTPTLSVTGKAVIIVAMFIGRIGPLTLALALGRKAAPVVGYPETRIMVG